MKIGIDCRLWNESGVGRYIRNLVLNLQKIHNKNEYVLFVLNKDRHEILNQALPDQNDIFRIVKADIWWHTVEEQLKFPQIINKENLDLMHFPYVSVPIFYNKPFIVTIHDLILYHYPTGEASTLPLPFYKLKLLGYKFVISKAAQKAKKILTVSQATKEEIIDHLGVDSDKVVVIYEGASNEITNPKSQTPNKSSVFAKASANKQNPKYKILNTKYFLYVGNAYPHKNLDRLIDVFNILISQYLNISLVLVGKEDYFYKRLKEKVGRMGLKDSVIFYGEATDEELQGLYRNALALIMPSFMEGFGLPALEAMANKCLVLASDIPSLREVCGNSALYFNPGSIRSFEKVLGSVKLNDLNHFTQNIEEGFKRARMFSWKKMARETHEIYESCVSL